ncbi:MAG: hypothetical protein IT237_01155 [Bacteroidia bacterium]|nr:hypothetical protein [Bacteroidia bacterium]
MKGKTLVNIEIDKLTNSIENVITGESFETEFSRVASIKEIKKADWVFDWYKELKSKKNDVYKMTTIENKHIIQGLVSLSVDEGFVFVNLVENAKFNRGKEKVYSGVGGNLFAFACLKSKELGFEGCISFLSKSSLFEYYSKSLGAIKTIGQRMVILEQEADELIKQYFKNK